MSMKENETISLWIQIIGTAIAGAATVWYLNQQPVVAPGANFGQPVTGDELPLPPAVRSK